MFQTATADVAPETLVAKQSRPLLSLVMIVKNEGKSLRTVLESVQPYIDCWTIVDTGSTDNTENIVRETLRNVPGRLLKDAFTGYASTRNRALLVDQQNNSSFQLMLSGDEHVHAPELRTALASVADDIDLFRVRVIIDNEGGNTSPRIFRTGSQWHYTSPLPEELHEFPTHPDKDAKVADLSQCVIYHNVSDADKRMDNIWEHHIPALRAYLLESPEDTYALTHCAAHLRALLGVGGFFSPGEQITYAMEAMSYARRRDALPYVSPDERRYVLYTYLACARYTGIYNNEELLARCKELQAQYKESPEIALLKLHIITQMIPVSPQLYEQIQETVAVCGENRGVMGEAPVDLTCEWKAHYIAATTCKRMAHKAPNELVTKDASDTWEERKNYHIKKGLESGGKWELFRRLLESEKSE